MTMTYRYLRRPPAKASVIASATWTAPMRQRQAAFSGDRLFVGGTIGSYDYVGYFSVAPDGSAVTFNNSSIVRVYNRTAQAYNPAPICVMYPNGSGGVAVWGVTNQNVTYDSGGMFNYIVTGTNQVADDGSAGGGNVGFNRLGTTTQRAGGFHTLRRALVSFPSNPNEYSPGIEAVTIYGNQPSTNSQYAGYPITCLTRLGPNHMLVGYNVGTNTKWDIYEGSTRAYIDVPFINDGQSVFSTLEMRGNVLCLYGANKATSAIWDGAGTLTVQSQVPVVTSGKVFPVDLPDGRIFVAQGSANSRCLNFNPATGFTMAASQFENPAVLFAAMHASGKIVTVGINGTTISLLQAPL